MKIDDLQRYLLVGVSVFGMAIIVRLILLSKGFDSGTANLVFIAVFVFGMVVYWALSSVLTDLFTPLFNNLLSHKKGKSLITDRTMEVAPMSAETPERPMTNDLLIHQFCEYSRILLGQHLMEGDLSLIYEYIRSYAYGQSLKNMKQIRVTNLTSADLYHYGWNLWYHFGKKDKQDNVVAWLKSVFVNLKEIEDATIKGKLTIEEKNHYIIELCKDIAGEYLRHD